MIPRYQQLPGEDDPEAYRRAYAGHVRYVDRHVGDLLDGLRELRLYDDALVVVTSDHGESLGEHGWYFCHGNLVYQEQIRVPLLVKLPGNDDAGRVVAAPVEGVDVAPTVLRVLGLDDTMRADGRVILADALGDDPRPRFTQSDDAEVLAAITGSTKLVLRVTDKGPAGGSHPARAVFDLERDPGEMAPGTGEPAAATAELEEGLRRHYRDIPRAGASRTAEQEERLRALGYTR
jgi:arylsulfatase A-like enzyme